MPIGDVTKTIDNVAELMRRIGLLTGSDVLVGVPREESPRKEGTITNAALAYIHNFGSPARNIPARPFLTQGVKKARETARPLFRKAALDALEGREVEQALERIGMMARNAVVKEITDPAPPFAPLKLATIRNRLRKTAAGRRKIKQAQKRREEYNRLHTNSSLPADSALKTAISGMTFTPLIDSGQLRASITYVVRKG